MRRVKTGFLFLLATALLVVSAGCPDSTPISSGNGSVLLSVFNENPGKWDGGVFFSVDRIAIRPTDPEADDLLGNRNLLLLQDAISVDSFTPQVDPAFFQTLHLPPGQYQIVELNLSSFFFSIANPVNSPTECEYLLGFDTPMNNFTNPATFTLHPGEDAGLVMVFDLEALSEAMIASFDDPGYSLAYPFCDGPIDRDLLAAEIGNFLTLE